VGTLTLSLSRDAEVHSSTQTLQPCHLHTGCPSQHVTVTTQHDRTQDETTHHISSHYNTLHHITTSQHHNITSSSAKLPAAVKTTERGGKEGSWKQVDIDELLVKLCLDGRQVARLKAWGLLRTRTRPTLNRAFCRSIHPEGTSMSHAPISLRVLVLNDPPARAAALRCSAARTARWRR